MDTQPKPQTDAKTARENPRRWPSLPEPLVIREWKRNRHGETLRVTLSTFNEHNVVDLRTWWADEKSQRRPGKGLTVSVAHLYEIERAIGDAIEKALELGLIKPERVGDE